MNKICRVCKKEKNLDRFVKSKSGKHGTLNVCKPCKARESREYTKDRRKHIYRLRYKSLNSNRDVRLKSLIAFAKQRSVNKNLDFDIDFEYIEELFIRQDGKCHLSGIAMNIESHSPYIVSIDRVDRTKGYTKDNIQLVCSCVNMAKNKLDDDVFIDMCNKISDRNK